MFLANSLKEKLKRDYVETDDEVGGSRFRYDPPSQNPKLLFSIKETMKSSPDIQSRKLWHIPPQQLHSLDKREWENTFTVSKLHLKWKEKDIIDFDRNYRKFPEDCAFPGVAENKALMHDLKDPDILELKQKKWNISVNVKEKNKPELKKTIFEIKNGLNDFKIVPLKQPMVPEGVESRNKIEIDGNVWNISNSVDRQEIKDKDKEEALLAKENTVKYWKKNEENRYKEKPLPISNERKNIEFIRYYKKYRTPYQKTVDYQKVMDKVRELTFLERENVEKDVKKKNPGMEKFPEKINALVFKDLYRTYRDKYNELTGNLSKEELKKLQMEKKVFKWKDRDLANKITAINKMTNTGIFDDNKMISNYKKKQKNDIDIQLANSQSTKNTLHRSQSLDNTTQNILLPLVIKGNDICKEEIKIEEKLEEEYKKEQKRQLLLEARRFSRKKIIDKFESRYPLTKEEYMINKKVNAELKNNNKSMLLKNLSKNNISENAHILNEISKSSECNPHFLEAYNNIVEKEFEKMNEMSKKMKDNITYKYTHPGVYRKFTFVEKDIKVKYDLMGQQTTEIIPKKVTESFWSCCMNSDPNSQGCQKKAYKSFKWNYN